MMAHVLAATRIRAETAAEQGLDRLRLTVATDITPLAFEWRDLEARCEISPYQSYDFIAAWARRAAAQNGVEVRVGVVRDEWGKIAAILPFGVTKGRFVTTAHYLGASHSNLNMPLVSRAHANRFQPETVKALLTSYGEAVGADLLVLSFQPEQWRGLPHPFAGLPRQASTGDVKSIVIPGDYETLLQVTLSRNARSKLRRKEKRLLAAQVGWPERARKPEEVTRVIDAFTTQKGRQLAEMGAGDPFAAPEVGSFLVELGLAGLEGDGGLVLHSLSKGGEILAVRGTLRRGSHASLFIQSFDMDHDLASESPGEVLFGGALAQDIAEGVREVDLGVGRARYKDSWANAVMPMFDVTLPLTQAGQAYAAAERARIAGMRSIKASTRLYGTLKSVRALIGRIRRRLRNVRTVLDRSRRTSA
jgi:CelD/BcsL family acetyltransferase involved in cellulose biosynthesis